MIHRRLLGSTVAIVAMCTIGHAQTTGLTPLNDLGAGTYQGFQGGLYPGGMNTPPAAHLAAALQMANQIVPRDAAGAPDPDGLIAMIAVGMSNTTHEFGAFERQEDANSNRNARVVLMDTGFGGQTATVIANPNAAYWTTMQQRLTAMGLSSAQVQVAWLKEAEANPLNNFPTHAQGLRDNLELIANNLHDKFPNLKLCYLSSRIYGGYASPGSLNPEPQAYESGFSAKWLIEEQINGDSGLNYGQLAGAVRAPLLLWGPYLWADGATPRSDGLTWLQSDFENDFTHPAPAGEQKVANLLSAFFASDATTAPWWSPVPDTALVTVDVTHDAYVMAASPNANFGAATQLLAQGGAAPINAYLQFNLGAVAPPIALAKLSARVVGVGGGGPVSLVTDTQWNEGAITYNTAPPIGPGLIQMPQSSKDGTIGANVTSAVNADPDGLIGFAVTTAAMGQASYHSKEGAQPPRLVLVVPCAPDSDGDGLCDSLDACPALAEDFDGVEDTDGCPGPNHDSVVVAAKPLKVTISASKPIITKRVRVTLVNADAGEPAGHPIRLAVTNGCTATDFGSLAVTLDANGDGVPGDDTVTEVGEKRTKARLTLTFTTAGAGGARPSPTRCTVELAVSSPGGEDPRLSNNQTRITIDLIDPLASPQPPHDSMVQARKPLALKLHASATTATKVARVKLTNADAEPAHQIDTTVINGCPPTLTATYDANGDGMAGDTAVSVGGEGSVSSKLTLTATGGGGTKLSPERCTIGLNVSSPAGLDPRESNNATTVDVDVIGP